MQENRWYFSWMKKKDQLRKKNQLRKILKKKNRNLSVMDTIHLNKEIRPGHQYDWGQKRNTGKTRSQTKEMASPRNESMERADLTMEDWIQETVLISAVTSGPTEPKTFQETWHYPIEKERDNWRVAIRKEIRSMIERGVWKKTDRKKIPSNRRLFGNKWVFKIKRDGTFRARLLALGYSQIPGVDYTDNFAPVAHDVSLRRTLARMMVENLDSLVMDVETKIFVWRDR